MSGQRIKDNTVSDEQIIELYLQSWEIKDIEKKYGYKKGGLGYRVKKLKKEGKIPYKWGRKQDMGVLNLCHHNDCIYLTPFDNTWACYYCVINRKPRPCVPSKECIAYRSSDIHTKNRIRKDLFIWDEF